MTSYRLVRVLTAAVLMLIGIFGVLVGVAYIGELPPNARGPRLLDSWFSIRIWAFIWIGGGVGSCIAALWAKPWGAAVVIGMLFAWGFGWGWSWVIGGDAAHRDWLNLLVFFVPGLLLICTVALAAVALRATAKVTPHSEQG